MAQMTADMARRIIANWEATKKHYGITAWEECQLAHAFLAKNDQSFRAGMRAAAEIANALGQIGPESPEGTMPMDALAKRIVFAILAEADK